MYKRRIVKIAVLGIIVVSLPIRLLFAQNNNPIDTNADGVLTEKEQIAFMKKVVKDTNGDGKISWEEELPFWKIRYNFDTWKEKEYLVRKKFILKESDLPGWVVSSIGNEIASFNDKNKKELYLKFNFYNLDSGIEAQEELLKRMVKGMSGGGSLHWERVNIGNVSFQYVEKATIYIDVLQDNIVVQILYADFSGKSTRDSMIKKHLLRAQGIAKKIETLIRETPLRKK